MNTYTTKFLIITAIISFVVGIGAGRFLFKTSEPTDAPKTLVEDVALEEGLPEASPSAIAVTENSVAVFDQPAGGTVRIQLVSLVQDGWVVIHEDRDGAPGNILGAQRFTAGSHPEGGEVELLRWTETGNIYYAMLHTDTEDRSFDLKVDLPLTDENKKIIMVKFTTL